MSDNNIIRAIRKNNSLTQEKFAKAIGFSRSAVAQVEAGHNNISKEMIDSIISNLELDEELKEKLNDEFDKKNNQKRTPIKTYKWYDENNQPVEMPFDPAKINKFSFREFEENYKKLTFLRNVILNICSVISNQQIYNFSNEELKTFEILDQTIIEQREIALIQLTDKKEEWNTQIKMIILMAEDLLNFYSNVLKDSLGKTANNFKDLT